MCHRSSLLKRKVTQTPIHPPRDLADCLLRNPSPSTHSCTPFPNQQPGAPPRSDPQPPPHQPCAPRITHPFQTSGPLWWSPGLLHPCSSRVRTEIPDVCLSLPLCALHCPTHARPVAPGLWPTVLPGPAFANQDFHSQWPAGAGMFVLCDLGWVTQPL